MLWIRFNARHRNVQVAALGVKCRKCRRYICMLDVKDPAEGLEASARVYIRKPKEPRQKGKGSTPEGWRLESVLRAGSQGSVPKARGWCPRQRCTLGLFQREQPFKALPKKVSSSFSKGDHFKSFLLLSFCTGPTTIRRKVVLPHLESCGLNSARHSPLSLTLISSLLQCHKQKITHYKTVFNIQDCLK